MCLRVSGEFGPNSNVEVLKCIKIELNGNISRQCPRQTALSNHIKSPISRGSIFGHEECSPGVALPSVYFGIIYLISPHDANLWQYANMSIISYFCAFVG